MLTCKNYPLELPPPVRFNLLAGVECWHHAYRLNVKNERVAVLVWSHSLNSVQQWRAGMQEVGPWHVDWVAYTKQWWVRAMTQNKDTLFCGYHLLGSSRSPPRVDSQICPRGRRAAGMTHLGRGNSKCWRALSWGCQNCLLSAKTEECQSHQLWP